MNLKSNLLAAAFSVFALQAVPAGASQAMFETLDADGDGLVTLEEAEASSNDDLIESFEDGDENNDGKLDAAEFESMDVTDE
jgi:Ca2+-binding EF-hand superfamily protein